MDKNTPTEKEPSFASWLDSPAAKWSGALAGIAATLVTGRIAISNAFHNTMNKGDEGAFKKLQKARDHARAEVTRPAVDGVKAVLDAPQHIRQINTHYEKEYGILREKLGFRNNLMGVFDEMKVLKTHQWQEVIFATAAVASVAVGAIFAIASNREVAQKQKEFEEKQDKKELLEHNGHAR